jgi:NAD(P)-dependent dehydrogenase (short-subunit alcohol dehydrogenase family)
MTNHPSLRLVDVYAATLPALEPRIDVLVNNTGGLFAPRQATRDGPERTFAVNETPTCLSTSLKTRRTTTSTFNCRMQRPPPSGCRRSLRAREGQGRLKV